METIFMVALIIVSVAIIIVVLMQSGRSAGLSGAITGGAEQLFGKKKARGLEAFFGRATTVLAILFFLLAVGIAYFV
ncbi:MAG TPA: preprotein translocase subunit SecG [Bacillales bacterium]|nr:preprotein translocase subunit SecG [Bacillales bacterium]